MTTTSAFGHSYEVHDGFVLGKTYISALFKLMLANVVGDGSSGAVCVECPVK